MSSLRRELGFFDREILRVLLKQGGWMTAGQIAKMLKTTWNTVNSHLNKMQTMDLVISKKEGGLTIWRVNR